ncbi:unnamed protein product [Darwinula stevensoni]|uniref:Thioredoxin domain-containing protein 17 n=1 Tax=Darwinula stevensoni TaxID=69355 RepID=A0A7R8X901_9CRUS|nr:unnamed protein product [Darwinula stevensoni]CAG0889191.1 unnamed protein product [Darwinula stevensoni]
MPSAIIYDIGFYSLVASAETMAKIIEVNGFDGFVKAVADLETVPDLFVLFSGSKNPAGVNWCSDCTRAEPVIKEFLKSCPDVVLLYVGVGDRDITSSQA